MGNEQAKLERVQESIEALRGYVTELELKAAQEKKIVNTLCQAIGRPAIYRDGELTVDPVLAEDQFYGLALGAALIEAFRWRRAAGQGAASVDELLDLLRRGGVSSRASNAENARRSLLKVLREDPQFHKLPRGKYGLAAWYPHVPKAGDVQPFAEPPGEGEPGDHNAQAAA